MPSLWNWAPGTPVRNVPRPLSPTQLRKAGGRVRVLSAILAVCGVFCPGIHAQGTPESGRQTSVATERLNPGQTLHGRLGGGRSRSYTAQVQAGQFLHVVVIEKGVDVSVSISAGNRVLARLHHLNQILGEVHVSAIAESDGVLQLTLRSRNASAAVGQYDVEITDSRAPTAADRKRIDAEHAYMEGVDLYEKSTLESRMAAIGKWEESLGFWLDLGDSYNQAMSLANIAYVQAVSGDTQRASATWKQALPLWHKAGALRDEATTFQNIAVMDSELGDLSKALEDYNRALPIERAVDDRDLEATTLTNIGEIHLTLGESRTALDFFEKARKIARAGGYTNREASAALGSAGTLYELGQPQESLKQLLEALQLWQRVAFGDRDGEGATLDSIGWLYLDSGDAHLALPYFERALEVARSRGDKGLEAGTLQGMGDVYSYLGKNDEAFDYYVQALPLFGSLQDPLGEAYFDMRLMEYWKRQNSAGVAILFGKEGIDRFQQMRRNIQNLGKQAQQSFVKPKEFYYRELAGLLIAQSRLPEALQVMDMLKVEEYADFTRHRGAEDSPMEPPALDPAEKKAKAGEEKLEADIIAVGKDWAELKARKSTLSADEAKRFEMLTQQLGAADGRMRQYLMQLSSDFQDLQSSSVKEQREANDRQSHYGDETDILKSEVLKNAEPGTVAIYTVVQEDRLSEIVITPQTMWPHDVMISATKLQTKVFDFMRLFHGATPSENDVKTSSQALYDILFGPAMEDALRKARGEDAQTQTILWSLDGVLRYIPIAALYDGKQYVVERYRNVEVIPGNGNLPQDPKLDGAKAVAMGISKVYDPTDRLDPLKSVPAELNAVVHSEQAAGSHGPIAGQILLDDSFTEQSMVTALDTQPRVVHIASHYVFEPGTYDNSFLLLGGKEKGGQGFHLTLAELHDNPEIDFHGAELVTLSGCETAQGGNDAEGHEVEGLGKVALTKKHAKAVMASLWKVDDASTGLLMAEFYKRWISAPGTGKAEALRQAQLSLLHGSSSVAAPKGGQSYANPYYWAPFILMGNWK